ncbi:MAG: hypothetical protein K2K08_05135 [Paramuribaculum sp.]|nr:hypothetical protein [Paramuribaculum sp.]
MANKRQLKKEIRYICGDAAAECALAKYLVENVNKNLLDEVLREVAALQEETLSRVNVNYDKVPKNFESLKAYNIAKNSFMNKAFSSIVDEFNKRMKEIVEKINSALPQKKD